MLRHYDKLGLLLPEHIDEGSGYRYYAASQLGIVGKIGQLKELGFSLALIKEMLDSHTNQEDLKLFFRLRYNELQEELQLMQKQVSQLTHLLEQEEAVIPYHVILKEIPERAVLSTRGVIHTYEDEGQLWQTLYTVITEKNINVALEPYAMAIFHDQEYKTNEIDVEVQVTIEDYRNQDTVWSQIDGSNVSCYNMPATEVASVIISGSYEQMTVVTQSVAHFIEDHHYELYGPMFNIYHVSAAQNPDPSVWVTEACFPVRLSPLSSVEQE